MIHYKKDVVGYESLCGAPVLRGDALAPHGPEGRLLHLWCKDCINIQDKLDIEAEKAAELYHEQQKTFPATLERWARVGEGHYGELEWVAIAAMSFGIAIPFVFARKHIAKWWLSRGTRKDV